MENNAECKKQIMTYLNDSPDLTVYYYRAWSDDQRTKLHGILQDISGNPGTSYSNTATPSTPKAEAPKAEAPKTETKANTESSENNEDLESWLNGVG